MKTASAIFLNVQISLCCILNIVLLCHRIPVPERGGSAGVPEEQERTATSVCRAIYHRRVLPQHGRLHVGGIC